MDSFDIPNSISNSNSNSNSSHSSKSDDSFLIESFNEVNINEFIPIKDKKIKIKENILYNEIESETSKIQSYFIEKTKNFPKLFNNNIKSLEEAYKYLELHSIPNKCECAGIIDTIPGWRCVDCSKYENAIYCSNCYFKSKNLHKGHKVYYLRSSGGMCDCGDPDSLNIFCSEHSGPYTKQKQINEFIEKSFSPDVLKNLKIFFDDLFIQFSKYFILTEKCKYFITELLNDNKDDISKDEKNDILLLKKNFGKVFQNFLDFLYKITEKNLGIFHLIANYLLKNHFMNEQSDTKYKISHACVKMEINNIKILFKNKNENKDIFSCFNFDEKNQHKCECPFIRLLFSNWRDNIICNKNGRQNRKLLLSFSHNLFLRSSLSMLFIFLYKELLINNNEDVLYIRNQYSFEESMSIIAKNTTLIEDTYDFLYYYLKNIINSNKSKDHYGAFKKKVIKERLYKIDNYMYDSKYYLRPFIIPLIGKKSCIYKRLIDIACIFHNQMEFKSIFPHPQFQEKKCKTDFMDIEAFFLFLVNIMYICIQWDNIKIIKETFNYFLEKIFYKKEIKILESNEYSYHLTLYRAFGCFLNFFSINYALINKTDINSSINFIKNRLFNSKEDMQEIITLILNDYYRMFGFILGIRNEYFKYYDIGNYNYIYFNDLKELLKDFTLIKYLIVMSEEKINLEDILRISNIENVYSFFSNVFNLNNETERSIITKDEDENKHVMQWKRILEMIISIIKNDSSHICCLLSFFDEALSSKIKKSLFDSIRNNKYMMRDCRNILKEKIVQIIVSNGNLIDLENLKNDLDDFFFTLFENKEFNFILNELTLNKMNGEKKEFYLKDSSLKYLDMNYYLSPITKSKAELYIIDFKKDIFKLYNSYYYQPSEFIFDFHHKVYENILLNVENIKFFTKIIEILLNQLPNQNKYEYDLDSIKKVILPIILNYLSMFGCINSKIFIIFKKKMKF